MLEARRLVIRRRATDSAYHIYDPDGDAAKPVGVAEDMPGPLARLLVRYCGSALSPARVEVRELPDDSLVFTLSRRRWPVPRVAVHDALGEPVGSLRGQGLYDSNGCPFASIIRNEQGFGLVGRLSGGVVTLGHVVTGCGKTPDGRTPSGDTRTVEFAEELADDPFAKMLVLATALAG